MSRRSLRPIARTSVRRLAFALIALIGAGRRLRRGSRQLPDGDIDRILVIRMDLLGDVLLSTPLVRALRHRYPSAHLTMLTLPYTAPLAQLFPEVDEVVAVDTDRIRSVRGLLSPSTWKSYRATLGQLRSRRFDLAMSVYGRMGSLCAALSGARVTIGYAREAYPFLLDRPIPGGRFRERKHEVEYGLSLADALGTGWLPSHLTLPTTSEARSQIRAKLSRAGVQPDERLVLIHAGSINGSAKRWPAQSWGAFADAVIERTGARVVLVGASSDVEIANGVRGAARSPVISLVGDTTVPELAALIREAELIATGDSGPLHLAVALERPLLAVYGPTDPRIYGPYRPQAPTILHRADLPCSPCYTLAHTAECPLGDPICMRLVTVEQMVTSALQLLGDADSSASHR